MRCDAPVLTVRTTDHTFAVTVSGDADANVVRALTAVLAESARAWPFVVIDLCGGEEAGGRHRRTRASAGPLGSRSGERELDLDARAVER